MAGPSNPVLRRRSEILGIWSSPDFEPVRVPGLDAGRVRTSPFAGLDPLLMVALAGLGGLGILNLQSLGDSQEAVHQGVCVLIGMVAMVASVRIGARRWRALAVAIYGGALLLLGGVAAAGSIAYGAQRWLSLGALVFQPSELAKLGLLLMLAVVLGSLPRHRHRLLMAVPIAAVPIALTLLEPDLSTAILLALVAGAMLLLARVRVRSLLVLGVGIALLAPIGLSLMRPYQLERLHAFLNGGADAQGAGWAVLQSHIAIASGGLLGTVSALPRDLLAQYLPARETDLAFASLIEERGVVAGALVLFFGAVAVWRLVSAATRTRTEVGSLVAAGFATLLGAEIAINVAGNLGVLPLAGVPFPLLSSGGSAVVAHCVAAGMVMGARRDELRRRLWCPPRFARPRPRLARLTAAGVVVALLGLAAGTVDLRQTEGPELRSAALLQATRRIALPAARGEIQDRHGVPLALDKPVVRVLDLASVTLASRGTDRRLAALLGEPLKAVDHALAAMPPNQGFDVVVAASVPDNVGIRIAAADLPGVIVAPTVQRSYPYGPLLAPLLGFVGVPTAADEQRLGTMPPDEIIGRGGLEQEYDAVLRGDDGSQEILVDPTDTPVAISGYQAPVGGGDLRLSIDLGLQEQAAMLLQRALRGVAGQPRGDEGSVVIMNPQNGQVLAMVSLPAYNDSLFGPPVDAAGLGAELNAPGDPFLEHATETAMPPGSTFKLVVAATDLATHVVSSDLVVPTGSTFAYDGTTFHNWGDLPPQDLSQAVAWSNDVYFYKLAIALGATRIDQIAATLGVGKPTGIDLPGEATGFLGTPTNVSTVGEQWYPGTTAMFGIGQGPLTVTPLQDALWTGAVATGEVVTPRLGLSAQPAGGQAFVPMTPPPPRRLPFAASLGPLQEGLRDAVINGTGTMLRVLPIPAAGKTGTAQDSSAPDGGPDAWYTAYSPAGAPQVVVTVNVRGGGEGYNTAEPIVRDLLKYFDIHAAQILSTAPAQPAVPPAIAAIAATRTASVTSMNPVTTAAALQPQPTIALRRQQLHRAEKGSTPHLLPRRSAAALHTALRIQTPPRGALRNPAAANHRRRQGPLPA